MRTTRSMLAAGVALAVAMTLPAGVATAAPADDDGGGRSVLVTRLSGAAELPGPGDEDGRGVAVLVVDADRGTIRYLLRARGIDPAAAAHIHEIAADGVGPIVQDLQAPTDGSSRGLAVNAAVAEGLLANPGDYYVNVHNPAFPAGAIRGDLG